MIPPLLALGIYPLVIAAFFARLDRTRALCLSILVGYLFLPEKRGVNLPLLPTLEKDTVPAIVAAIACMILTRQPRQGSDPHVLAGWIPKSTVVKLLMGLLLVGASGTVMTNLDPISFNLRTVPGLRPYDIGSTLLYMGMVLLPFLLARRFLGHPDTHLTLLWVLVAMGLLYSLFALYEVRMSPQLNIQIYGYFQHEWIQHMRGGGFRPIVFLQHGLWVSLFFATTILAALALYRGKIGRPRALYLCAAGWLLITLVLTKSLGALIIVIALAPVLLFLNTRLMLIAAVVVASIVMTYPFLRSAHLVPIDGITAAAESINPGRARSLETRLRNEDLLLAKAQQKPLFGWGSWGRERVYNEDGFSVTIPDGYWIIVIGQYGWVGYIAVFGLLSSGIFGLARNARKYEVTPATAGLAVVLAGNMVDLIPNAGLTPVTWLVAGALLGRLEHGRIAAHADDRAVSAPAERQTRYSRFPPRANTPPAKARYARNVSR